jgi:hypothetical protein
MIGELQKRDARRQYRDDDEVDDQRHTDVDDGSPCWRTRISIKAGRVADSESDTPRSAAGGSAARASGSRSAPFR